MAAPTTHPLGMKIQSSPLPDHALLRAYEQPGGYTDCFATEFPGPVTPSQYVLAFYTTPLFKCERFILRWAIARPSTDAQAAELAAGSRDAFAAWTVEKRDANQLLLTDIFGSTRSWLMTEPIAAGTRLYFGSAVVPRVRRRPSFGLALEFHKLYSRALLSAAHARLLRDRAGSR